MQLTATGAVQASAAMARARRPRGAALRSLARDSPVPILIAGPFRAGRQGQWRDPLTR